MKITIMKIFFIFIVAAFSLLYIERQAQAAYYDLEVLSIYTIPAKPAINVECQLIVEIRSNSDVGLTDTAGFSSYEYTFNNFDIISQSIPDISSVKILNPAATANYVFKGYFTRKGANSVSFLTDKENDLGETDMSNNTLRGSIEVGPPDEIAVTGIEVWPKFLTVDENSIITVTVYNSGYRDLISSVGLSSYSIDFPNFTKVKATPPDISVSNKFMVNSSATYKIEGYFTSAGSKNLNFTVDTDNQLDETDKTNNKFALAYNVAPLSAIDLTVDSIIVTQSTGDLLKGVDTEIIVTVKNLSSYSLVNGNGFLDRDCIFKFDGFETREVTHAVWPTFAAPLDPAGTFAYHYKGQFYNSGGLNLSAELDTLKSFAETNEANNKLVKTIIVYASQNEADGFELSGVTASLLSSSTALITWQTTKDANGEVQYRRSIFNLFDRFVITPRLEAWPVSLNTKTHAVTLVNLRPNDNYVYKVFSNRNGVARESGELSFYTPADDQLKLSGEITTSVNNSLGQATIAWNTNLAANGYVYYKLAGLNDYLKTGSDQYSGAHSYILNSLSDGKYLYYIESLSKVNTAYKSAEKEFTITKTVSSISSETASQSAAAVSPNSLTANNGIVVPPKTVTNPVMYQRLKGKILLTVEAKGEAYYANPQNNKIYYLGRPDDAFSIMRELGIGIISNDLKKIPLGLGSLTGADSDGDGLVDSLEDSLGTNKNIKDSDNDGFDDKVEIIGGFNPSGTGKLALNSAFSQNQKGKIFLQVESKGEAWYINPVDGKRYFLSRPADAFECMRSLGLGISNDDFKKL